MKRLFLTLLVLLAVLVCSCAENAEHKKIKISGFFEQDGRIIVQNDENELYEYKAKGFSGLGIKLDGNLAFVFEDVPYIFEEDEAKIVKHGKEKTELSLLDNQSLISGGCILRNFKISEDELYFICECEGATKNKLFRYSFFDKKTEFVEFEGRGDFYINSDSCVLLSYKGESTLFNEVDFSKKSLKTIFELKGELSCAAKTPTNIYAVDRKNSSILKLDLKGNLIKVSRDYNAIDALAGFTSDGEYCILSREGMYFPSFEEKADSSVLKIYGIKLWETEKRFMKEHPDVRLEEIPESFSGMINFSQAYISGAVDFDVAVVSLASDDVDRLFEKGYFYDMSNDEILRQKALELYEPIKSKAFSSGRLACFPFECHGESVFRIDKAVMKKFGLSERDIPQTTEELLDFVIEKQTSFNQNGESSVIWLCESPKSEMFYHVQNAYIDNFRRKNKPLDFDTPLYRRLMEKMLTAIRLTPEQSYEELDALMHKYMSATDIVEDVDCRRSIPLEKGENPKYKVYLRAYLINPKSKNVKAALEYVRFCIERLDDRAKLLLFDMEHKPLIKEDFNEYIENQREQKRLLEKALADEKNNAQKRELEEKLAETIKNIDSPDDFYKYSISPSYIAYYQNEFIKNAESAECHESTRLDYVLKNYIKNFLDGKISLDNFIEHINNREKLKRLENGAV